MRWRSLGATVDGALVERMGLSMVRQLGLQVVWRHDRGGCRLVDDGRQLVVAVLCRLDAVVAAG
jgi:hypothetical protein